MVTRNPGPLRDLENLFRYNIGPYWLGTIGDENHDYGYHLGASEVPANDYSVIHPRDKAGIAQFGGDWASGFDVGMGWPAAREWLAWTIDEASRGKFPDIREIIGSLDGEASYVWDFPSGQMWLHTGQPHITHAHFSIFRDSIFRSHLALVSGWSAQGRITKVAPEPTLVIPTVSGLPAVVDVDGHVSAANVPFWGPRTVVLAAGLGALGWVVQRRMERQREGLQQNPR